MLYGRVSRDGHVPLLLSDLNDRVPDLQIVEQETGIIIEQVYLSA